MGCPSLCLCVYCEFEKEESAVSLPTMLSNPYARKGESIFYVIYLWTLISNSFATLFEGFGSN